jgi:hypothetical protein
MRFDQVRWRGEFHMAGPDGVASFLEFLYGGFGGIDLYVSISEATRIREPGWTFFQVVHVDIRGWRVFLFNEVEIANDTGFDTSMIEVCHVLQYVVGISLKAFLEWSNNSLPLSGVIGGSKIVAESTSVEWEHDKPKLLEWGLGWSQKKLCSVPRRHC